MSSCLLVSGLYYNWAGSSKTFNNWGVELYKHLKFGSLVALLLDPLKILQNDLNVWYGLVIASILTFSHTFPIQKP